VGGARPYAAARPRARAAVQAAPCPARPRAAPLLHPRTLLTPPPLPAPTHSMAARMQTRDEALLDDNASLSGAEVQSFLTRVMYNRRNKMDPLWNTLCVAGFEEGKPTLGYVDLRGTTFSEDFLATGFGAHMALPLIRERWRADLDEAAARTLLEDCMRVLWYRDCRALNKIQIAKVTAGGVAVSAPFATSAKWDYASFVAPKAGVETGGSW
jgi:20S proteasome subunit beta 7